MEIPQVVLAPLAGGPSTPELAAAVTNAGGLGFVAGGYLSPSAFAERLARARELTRGPLGVNVFVLRDEPVDDAAVAAYARELAGEGPLGTPRFDDDALEEKVAAAVSSGVDVISTTFSAPPAWLVDTARAAGLSVWATVSMPGDARSAAAAGADVLVVQGSEAGGHRGSFDDADTSDLALLDLLAEVRAGVELPLVAAGGIVDAQTAAAARAAGAVAVQAGTAFLLCPEAGTHPVHRAALERGGETAITRAFTGRRARGIVNRFMRDHPDAPSAYPHINNLTTPLRAAAREAGDADRVNLWAGTRFDAARREPAADVVRRLHG